MKRIGFILPAILALGFLSSAAPALHAQSEEAVKSAFLYNFAKLVTWPAKSFPKPNTPITIGFLGGSSLADTFEQAVKGRNVAGRDIVVVRLTGTAGSEACQIVYVADASQAAGVTTALKGSPVLLVGESEGFLEAGGIIRFFKDGPKIAFEINLVAAKTSSLEFNPKLLGIAKSVKGTLSP